MSRKSRGCQYERDLVHSLQERGFYSVRVAGSGCMHYPSPDILASNGKRLIAFEVKSSQKDRVYLKERDLADLLEFSMGFRCEAWFAAHFSRIGWFFCRAEELKDKKVLKLEPGLMNRHFT